MGINENIFVRFTVLFIQKFIALALFLKLTILQNGHKKSEQSFQITRT